MKPIRLSEAIDNLREELRFAKEKGGKVNSDLQLVVSSVEIELEIIAEEEDAVSGKVNWYVFSGGVDSKAKDASKHKIKISLQAVDRGGEQIKVATPRTNRPD
jgi:hypothetical protein